MQAFLISDIKIQLIIKFGTSNSIYKYYKAISDIMLKKVLK